MRFPGACATAVVAALCGCEVDQGPPVVPPTLQLAEIASFGEAGLGVDQDVDSSVVPAGVLSSIADIAEDEAGRVYVLDRDLRRVVQFAPDGTVIRTIGEGYGDGPGEFNRPSRLTIEGDHVFVLDLGTARVSWFDTTGVFTSSIQAQVPNEAWSLAVSHDTIWVMSRPSRSNKSGLVQAYSMAGQPLWAGVEVSGRVQEFARYGEPGTLARWLDGSIVYATGVPFLWTRVTTPRWVGKWIGYDRWPDRKPSTEEDKDGVSVRVAPAGLRDMAQLSDGRVAVLYYEYTGGRAVDAADRYHSFLEILSVNGQSLGRYAFPPTGPYLPRIVTAAVTGAPDFFIEASEPYPRVARMEVRGGER